MVAEIVSAHVANNNVSADALPDLIVSIHEALSAVGSEATEPAKPNPVVPLKQSVFNDHLVCLECGKNLKMLKRHLNSDHEMTPEDYRKKFGLPGSYPITAPGYAKKRAKIAKEFGLGTFARKAKRREAK
jgi:predicted transcriptional regulator